MMNSSYQTSFKIKNYLKKIEELRYRLFITPINQKSQLQLRWDTNINRIYSFLILSEKDAKKSDIIELLAKKGQKTSKDQKQIILYKNALDYTLYNWNESDETITAQEIIKIHRMLDKRSLNQRSELQRFLNYLIQKENPVVLSAVAFIESQKTNLFGSQTLAISALLSNMILYKYAYHFRGLLSFEYGFAKDYKYFKTKKQIAFDSSNITLWIEYFAQNIIKELEDLLGKLLSKKTHLSKDISDSLFSLNQRQKYTLNLLNNPESKITNKDLQKKFKISQITASRDLAKLTELRLLFSHGKGRSVYYTKI